MRFHLPVLLALALGLAGCGAGPIKLVSSPNAPAASGELTTEEGENGNLKLAIEVKHLAAPEKVQPGAKVYVVWVEAAGAAPQNVGALRLDEDHTGRLDTTTPHRRFNLAITAEEEPTAAEKADPNRAGHVAAPFAGVVTMKVAQGAQVEVGATIATIEAMKMEASITTPVAGTVTRLAVTATAQVEAQDLLLVVE